MQDSLPRQLNKTPLKISADKYKHLQEFKLVMPAEDHKFYDELLHE